MQVWDGVRRNTLNQAEPESRDCKARTRKVEDTVPLAALRIAGMSRYVE